MELPLVSDRNQRKLHSSNRSVSDLDEAQSKFGEHSTDTQMER